jgi:hypothetical protein
MGVSPRLLEMMMAEPPESSREISPEECNDLLLCGMDPVLEEKWVALEARVAGLSSGEWRRRTQAAKRECDVQCRRRGALALKRGPGSPGFGAELELANDPEGCAKAAVLGITHEQYQQRWSEVRLKCRPLRHKRDGWSDCFVAAFPVSGNARVRCPNGHEYAPTDGYKFCPQDGLPLN